MAMMRRPLSLQYELITTLCIYTFCLRDIWSLTNREKPSRPRKQGSLKCSACNCPLAAYVLTTGRPSALPNTFCRSTASVVSLTARFPQPQGPYHLPLPEGCRTSLAQHSLDPSSYPRALQSSHYRKPWRLLCSAMLINNIARHDRRRKPYPLHKEPGTDVNDDPISIRQGSRYVEGCCKRH